jgi:hypothetical protein
MKTEAKKSDVKKTPVRELTPAEIARVAGGGDRPVSFD